MSKAVNAPTPIAEKVNNIRVAVIAAEWNARITSLLTSSAVARLKEAGLNSEDIEIMSVPGAIELTYGASAMIETGLFDAVIVFGCVVRGDTPHFDYVCQSVTQGVTALNTECDTPVIFGVLTVENEQQALDRCGGPAGDKGAEAADAALKMVAFRRRVNDL